MQSQKKSLTLPISVGIVLPVVLLAFTGLVALVKNFILKGVESSLAADNTSSDLTGIVGIFVVIGIVWLIAGIIWTTVAKQRSSK